MVVGKHIETLPQSGRFIALRFCFIYGRSRDFIVPLAISLSLEHIASSTAPVI